MIRGLLFGLVLSFISCNQVLAYDANYVLGQAAFDTSSTGTTETTLNGPSSVFYDASREWLYVSDKNNNRVLVYDLSDGIVNGEAAAHVLGQSIFTTSGTSVFDEPEGIFVDTENQKVTVSNTGIDDILTFDTSDGITDGEAAISVLDGTNGTSNFPLSPDIIIAEEKLFVLDPTHARILVFPTVSGVPTSGSVAEHVLGQSDLIGNASIEPSASGVPQGSGLAYDEDDGWLFVSMTGGPNYTRIFDIGDGITDGEDAVGILGPFSDIEATVGIIPNYEGSNILMKNAYDEDTQQFYITDIFEPRSVIFDISDGITNGEDAVSVLGQDAFNTYDSGTSESLISNFSDIDFDYENNRIFAVDQGNNRVLVYEYVLLTDNTALDDGMIGNVYDKTLGVANDQGDTEFMVISGSLPTGLSINTHGSISGTPSVAGDFDFTVRVTDSIAGGIHEFSDEKDFSITINAAPSSGGGGGSGSKIRGCMDSTAQNYNIRATVDNGECVYKDKENIGKICPHFTGYARKGDKNNDPTEVKKIQTFLNEKMSRMLFVDGIFGVKTDQAVRDFQSTYYAEIISPWTPKNGLTHTTGWWYQTTSAWANKLSGC